MGSVLIKVGKVVEVEDRFSTNTAGGMRVRAKLNEDKLKNGDNSKIPWAFPLLPKTFQTPPKVGEAVLVIADEVDGFSSGQRYYIGPLISQPQYNSFCAAGDATSLLKFGARNPIQSIDFSGKAFGAFPDKNDVAIIGRGTEDIALKYNEATMVSEVDIRSGIRSNSFLDVTNIMFNSIDPAYIQLKYKRGIATGEKHEANSLINIVADRINIMSNRDSTISHDLHDTKTLVKESEVDSIMDRLHQVPKGDKLVELLEIIKGAILHHVHPWPGMEQCGDKPGYINQLKDYDLNKILSEYVRIS